jgi:RNA polymerase sigma factor (sigma-70 family)
MAPSDDEPPQSPEQLFLDSQSLIDEAIRFACRHFRFPAEEARDFGQEVRLKLIAEDYKVLRVWQRKCSLKTYLSAVVLRFAQDCLDRLRGKYRNSAKAEELGEVARRLETLMVRDGLTYEHAKEILRAQQGAELTDQTFDELRAQLPPRQRRQFEGPEKLETLPTPDGNPEEHLGAKERERKQRAAFAVLSMEVGGLSARERMLLSLHFREGFKLSQIARLWKAELKPLYRELERILARLRKALEARGLGRHQILDLLRDLTGLDFAGETES